MIWSTFHVDVMYIVQQVFDSSHIEHYLLLITRS